MSFSLHQYYPLFTYRTPDDMKFCSDFLAIAIGACLTSEFLQILKPTTWKSHRLLKECLVYIWTITIPCLGNVVLDIMWLLRLLTSTLHLSKLTWQDYVDWLLIITICLIVLFTNFAFFYPTSFRVHKFYNLLLCFPHFFFFSFNNRLVNLKIDLILVYFNLKKIY